jgi:hypothetical protein
LYSCPQDDDDDPFFMPLPSAALKLADEKKFKLLAMPLSPEEEAKPMLELAGESLLSCDRRCAGRLCMNLSTKILCAPCISETITTCLNPAAIVVSALQTSQQLPASPQWAAQPGTDQHLASLLLTLSLCLNQSSHRSVVNLTFFFPFS